MSYKSKRARATDISFKTKQNVWERDGERCIFCGRHDAMPNAHIVSRAQGGLGIEENIVTACVSCHYKMDNSAERKQYLEQAEAYLRVHYPGWKREDMVYKKGS